MLHIKDLEKRKRGDTEITRLRERTLEGGASPPPGFLKRYDSERVRGWGSANDMIPWDLWGSGGGSGIRLREGAACGRGMHSINTGENNI